MKSVCMTYPYEGLKMAELDSTKRSFPDLLRTKCPDIERIYTIGEIALNKPAVSIIGARKASPYGLKAAYLLGKWAAEAGLVVVSGCAHGCDQQAHIGALEAGGSTLAVLGCGADVVYPSNSSALFREIATSGAILSIYPWKTPPAKYRFVQRNRVVAALSEIVCVAEAMVPSGTFSTVDHADKLNTPVAAVPGSIFSPLSDGPNRLISDGALVISNEEDFKSALGLVSLRGDQEKEEDEKQESRLVTILRSEAYTVAELADTLNTSLQSVLLELAELELLGVATRYPDGRYAVLKEL